MTEQPHATGAADPGFDANRLRSIGSMRRSRDDRMVAGVCAGVARHLNIDPVVVRVVVASLTFVGLAGLIVYVAAWLLVPEEGEDASLVDTHLPDNVDREQVRRLGLFIATAIAAASMLGSGFAFAWPAVPVIVIVLAILYFVAVRPYNRRQLAATRQQHTDDGGRGTPADAPNESGHGTDAAAAGPPEGPPPPAAEPASGKARNPRRDRGALLGLTTAVALLVLGAMGVYSASLEHVGWQYYPLAAFLVYAAGMIVGAFVGNGRPLALVGLPLALVLLATTVLPTYTVGRDANYPTYANDIESSYEQGVGDFVLDLSEIRDPDRLAGRTIEVQQGFGGIEVIVPTDLDVDVTATTDAGDLRIFGRDYNGAPVSRHYAEPDSDDPDLRLDLSQTAGQIRVTRP